MKINTLAKIALTILSLSPMFSQADMVVKVQDNNIRAWEWVENKKRTSCQLEVGRTQYNTPLIVFNGTPNQSGKQAIKAWGKTYTIELVDGKSVELHDGRYSVSVLDKLAKTKSFYVNIDMRNRQGVTVRTSVKQQAT